MGDLMLPQDLGNGLHLRRATPADAAALGRFNSEIHYETLGQSVEIMVSGQHPTVQPGDFLLIEDLNKDKKIAASGGLLGHTWRYSGIPFEGAYVECVGTDPAYRRRGLMRKVINAAHALSASKGQLVQLAGGIRWFYRRFGYEYALEGPGHREFPLVLTPLLTEGEVEAYHIRPSMAEDVPTLMQLYERACAGKLVTRSRSESLWRYHIGGQDQSSLSETYYTVLDTDGAIAAYYGTWADFPWGSRFIRELSVRAGLPLNAVLPAIQRYIQQQVVDNLADYGPTPPVTIQFDLGYDEQNQHGVYQALDTGLTPYRAWEYYVRVADIPAFLLHIAPVLEQRLVESR